MTSSWGDPIEWSHMTPPPRPRRIVRNIVWTLIGLGYLLYVIDQIFMPSLPSDNDLIARFEKETDTYNPGPPIPWTSPDTVVKVVWRYGVKAEVCGRFGPGPYESSVFQVSFRQEWFHLAAIKNMTPESKYYLDPQCAERRF